MNIATLHQLFLNSTGITTDTRQITSGQLFFALKGANFNGNEYADKAIDLGAGYVVIDEAEFKKSENFILVDNVLICLQELAKYHRQYLKLPIIGITGTNGKTTTKELISTVLSKKYNVGFTKGNLNNHIGVPLTLLSFTKETEIGVVEMGANHVGEIGELSNIALPDFGIVTNMGRAHIEGFGSFEGVIKTKSELYDYLRRNKKKAFVNKDDDLLVMQSKGLAIEWYSQDLNIRNSAELIDASPFLKLRWNDKEIKTMLVGEYNFYNVLAAITIGKYFNVSDDLTIKAISEYLPTNNRSQLKKTDSNTLIIDAYNANPTSMDLSIRNFANMKAENKILILGDMFELGELSSDEHKKIIDLVNKMGFKSAYFVGEEFYKHKEINPNFSFFRSTTLLKDYLLNKQVNETTILLKASRGIRLEEVVDIL